MTCDLIEETVAFPPPPGFDVLFFLAPSDNFGYITMVTYIKIVDLLCAQARIFPFLLSKV